MEPLRRNARRGPAVERLIPRSSDPAHIASNAAIFDFSLSDDDMALLAAATQPAGAPGDCAVA